MADGAELNWTDNQAIACAGISDAIAQLKAGTLAVGTQIEVCEGVTTLYTSPEEAAALLARLEMQVRLAGVAAEAAQTSSPHAPAIAVDRHAKALLDAIRNAR